MADRCNIHRGSGGRNRHNDDLFGIRDSGVNRNVYPERNLPCDEHISDIVDRHPRCGCMGRNSDRVGDIVTERSSSSSSDMRISGTDRRNNRRNHRNCLCKIVHCLCGRRRRRRDSSSS